jgi:hypothetical protein
MSAHLKAQLARFFRIFAAVFVPQLVALSGHDVTRSAILALIPAALEAAFRQFVKTVPAA